MPNLYFVIDVESIGLHGEAFAVAWVLIDLNGERLLEGCYSCPPESSSGSHENREWINKNVPKLIVTHPSPKDMMNAFWLIWKDAKRLGAVMAADCNWPVEATFLSDCISLDHKNREWEGPYPFIDLGSILLVMGKDPTGVYPRLEDEMPAHHPLMDARQSARILVDCLLANAS